MAILLDVDNVERGLESRLAAEVDELALDEPLGGGGKPAAECARGAGADRAVDLLSALSLVSAGGDACYPAERDASERGAPLGHHAAKCGCGWCGEGGEFGRVPILRRGLAAGDACAEMIRVADDCAAARGGWKQAASGGGTKHRRYATTDVHLDVLEAAGDATYAKMLAVVLPTVAAVWRVDGARLYVSEAFVVRYDAAEGAQRELEMHTDSSRWSLNVLLSEEDSFEGGGTYFETTGRTKKPNRGDALIHEGDLRHRGMPVTEGVRYILVAFIEFRS